MTENESVDQLLTHYANSSTIHGVRYIGSDQKSIRIFFTIAFICSMVGLGYYAYGVYTKWSIEPDIEVTMKLRALRDVPFPAITICSPLFVRDGLANYSKYFAEFQAEDGKIIPKLSVSQQNYLAAGIHACAPKSGEMILKGCPNRTEKDVVKLLDESFHQVDEALAACKFKQSYIKCQHMLNRVLTSNGFCYSMNMQGYHTIFTNEISKDFDSYKRHKIKSSFDKENEKFNLTFDEENVKEQWSLDDGYSSANEEIFPSRCMKMNQLSIYMNLNESDASNICVSQGRGYKIILHLPNEVPTPFHDEYFISFNYERMMTLTARAFSTDSDMKKYSPEQRRCYFQDERKLKYFNTYTKNHCDYECMTNFTLKQCGCVKFSMPHSPETPVCDLDKTKCYHEAISTWPDKDDDPMMPCNCLPTCNDIQYSIKLDKEAVVDASVRLSHIKGRPESTVTSRLAIRFNDHLIEEQKNFVAYKLQNFIADFGGLLGLFMGCSLLSIVELIFYCCKACWRKKEKANINIERVKTEGLDRIQLQDQKFQLSNSEFLNKIFTVDCHHNTEPR